MKTGRKGQSGNTSSRKGDSRDRRPGRDVKRPAPNRRPAESSQPSTEIIFGRNAVMEALRAGRRVKRLLVDREAAGGADQREAARLAEGLRIPVEQMDRRRLDSIAAEHQGLAAVVGQYPYASWGQLIERLRMRSAPGAVLLLDTLHDPQNLGTLLRTADALSLDAVVLPRHRAVHVTPAVVRASAGAVEHLTVPVVSSLVQALADLKDAGFWVAGLDAEGDREYWELDMRGPTALVLGGEDHGIGRLLKEKCDFLVRLPMAGNVNSLNASVAGSIVLYEMARQRAKNPLPSLEPGSGRG